MSWSIAWSTFLLISATQSLLKTVCLTPTLPAGSWLCHTLFFCSGDKKKIDFLLFLLPHAMVQWCNCYAVVPQTPAYGCRSPTWSSSLEHAGVSAAKPHDLLQQCARHPGAPSAACFPQWPPEGASRLPSVLHEGPSGGWLTHFTVVSIED